MDSWKQSNQQVVESLWDRFGIVLSIISFVLFVVAFSQQWTWLLVIALIGGELYLLASAELCRRNSEVAIRRVVRGSRSLVALFARVLHRGNIAETQQAFIENGKLRRWLVIEMYVLATLPVIALVFLTSIIGA